jgi:integrase
MTRIRLDYVHRFKDRHGRQRHYYRRNGRRVPLPGRPGSDEFMEAYARALAGESERPALGAARTKAGTVNAAVISYVNSAVFQAMAPETKRTRRNILERFRLEHGDKRIALIERRHVERMVAAKAATPSAARNFLNTLRALMQHCLLEGLIQNDPTIGVKRIKIKSDGYYAWSDEDVALFRDKHPLGTRARLALELLAGTALRRGDVVKVGKQHLRNGIVTIRQSKTGGLVTIPVLTELRAAIDAMEATDALTFLSTPRGTPLTPESFTNWFRDMCREAGLERGSAHGLRKFAARRLAEAGCSVHEIAAITGHTTLGEVARYTAAADRKRLAGAAVAKLTRTSNGKPE